MLNFTLQVHDPQIIVKKIKIFISYNKIYYRNIDREKLRKTDIPINI